MYPAHQYVRFKRIVYVGLDVLINNNYFP